MDCKADVLYRWRWHSIVFYICIAALTRGVSARRVLDVRRSIVCVPSVKVGVVVHPIVRVLIVQRHATRKGLAHFFCSLKVMVADRTMAIICRALKPVAQCIARHPGCGWLVAFGHHRVAFYSSHAYVGRERNNRDMIDKSGQCGGISDVERERGG